MIMKDVNLLCVGCFNQHGAPTAICPVCGYNEAAQVIPPHQLRPRTILNGKYLLGSVLGEGGFGITYIGWDLNLDIKVAIKEYYPSGFVTRETTVTSTVQPFTGSQGDFFLKGRDRFVTEARSLAKFRSMPGVVSVNDFFQENGTAYIVMEFIEGQTLKSFLSQMGGKLPAAQVFDMMKPVMTSLAEIHNSGIIHRDISPDNIIISKEGSVKLLDFGAAREFAESGNRSLSIMLKPGFAPEEQYRSKGKQGPWTDIYALSATMYKCITGITPDESLDRLQEDTLQSPSKAGFSLSGGQEAALMRGLAVFQKDRFQSVMELHSALYDSQAVQITVPVSMTVPAAVSELKPDESKSNSIVMWISKHKIAASGIGICLVGIIVIASMFFSLLSGWRASLYTEEDMTACLDAIAEDFVILANSYRQSIEVASQAPDLYVYHLNERNESMANISNSVDSMVEMMVDERASLGVAGQWLYKDRISVNELQMIALTNFDEVFFGEDYLKTRERFTEACRESDIERAVSYLPYLFGVFQQLIDVLEEGFTYWQAPDISTALATPSQVSPDITLNICYPQLYPLADRAVVDVFNAITDVYPNVAVNLEMVECDEYYDYLNTKFSAGESIDIFLVDSSDNRGIGATSFPEEYYADLSDTVWFDGKLNNDYLFTRFTGSGMLCAVSTGNGRFYAISNNSNNIPLCKQILHDITDTDLNSEFNKALADTIDSAGHD